MRLLERLRGYRTLIFNMIVALVPLWELLAIALQDPGLSAVIPKEYLPLYTLFVVLGNAYLRTQTTGPVGRK